MDGDKMGILLNKVADADEHRKINKALSDFARNKVPHIVEETYPARVVYAGGDDVLALAPLARDSAQAGEPSQVLELVDQLQEAYVKRVQGALQKDDKEGRQSVTASVGLTIAHHYTSLSYALRSARDAEGLAKHRYGRNSLVVTLLRRSGEQTRVGCHWSYPGLEPEGQPIQLFSRFYKLFKDDVLSPKCVYNLLEEAPALVKLAGPDKREFDSKQASSAMESEIKRVLKRQRASSKVNDFKDDELARYAWYIVRLAEAMDVAREEEEQKKAEEERRKGPPSTELYKDEWRYGLVEVLGWLLVMAFLARKEQEE
jgi:CRISPR-associated protein Cmr2